MSDNQDPNSHGEEEESEEDDDSQTDENQDEQPGFTFTKSAIADLPSTAVQSIHINNDKPAEVDDKVFVWRDVISSGTQLPVKTKFKKADAPKSSVTKQKQSASTNKTGGGKSKAKALPSNTSTNTTEKPKPSGGQSGGNEKVAMKTSAKPSGTSGTGRSKPSKTGGGGGGGGGNKASVSQAKVSSAVSQSRVKERRASGVSQGKSSTSGTKLTNIRSKGNSKTKGVPSREKRKDKKDKKDNNQSDSK